MQTRRLLSILFLIAVLVGGFAHWTVVVDSGSAAAPEAIALESSPANAERLAEVQAVMALAPTGREALTVLEQHQVKVTFIPGGGSYYLDASNTIVIEGNHQPVRAALSLVHETVHAHYWLEGQTADIDGDSREVYVHGRIAEEAEAVVAAIVLKEELRRAGVSVNGARAPLEDKYQAAYQAGIKEARDEQPYRSANEFRAIGREAGAERVVEAFAGGELLTSNTGQPYPDYYGNDWDDKQVEACGIDLAFIRLFC